MFSVTETANVKTVDDVFLTSESAPLECLPNDIYKSFSNESIWTSYTAEHRLFHSDIEYSVSQPADSEAVFSNLQELYIMLLNWFFPEKV